MTTKFSHLSSAKSNTAQFISVSMNKYTSRWISTLIDSTGQKDSSFVEPMVSGMLRRNWNPILIPHRTIPEPKGQDLDFVNVAHSYLIHSDWTKLGSLSSGLTTFRVKHVLLKIQKDHVLSLEFFNWVRTQNPILNTLETNSIMLHILARNRKFKSSESILRSILGSDSIELPDKLFDAILYSYRMCNSSPCVFDALFKTLAHMRKFRNATDTFSRMKDYGFLPTIESCNAFMSSLLSLYRADVALGFYREMRRNRISPNIFTLNMVIQGYCKMGKLDKAFETFSEIKKMGFNPNVVSYNTLISGYCKKGHMSSALNLKTSMGKNGINPNEVTFNTLMDGLCKEGKLLEANRLFTEMKAVKIDPNTVTYNILINGYSREANHEMGNRLYEEMCRNQVKADILTFNALISGLCRDGKTKKAAFLVKDLEKKNLVPNASTFSALISGQCARKNSDRAFKLYKTMLTCGLNPNGHTFEMLLSSFCGNEDFDGAVKVLREMLERRVVVSDLDMFYNLCNGLCKSGKQDLVMSLCSEMESRRLVPEGFNRDSISSNGLKFEIKPFSDR